MRTVRSSRTVVSSDGRRIVAITSQSTAGMVRLDQGIAAMKHHLWKGSCHCKTLRFSFKTRKSAQELPLRSCSCSFCVKRGTRCTSDPEGSVQIRFKPRDLADYDSTQEVQRLICRKCGVYVGTLLLAGSKRFVTLNVNTFDRSNEFTQTATPVDYSDTSPAQRKQRWTTVFTPVLSQEK